MRRLIMKTIGYATLLAVLALCPWIPSARAESLDGMLRVKLTRLGSPSTVTLSADCDLVADATGHVLPAGNALTASARDGQLTVQAGGETIASGKSVLLTRKESKGKGILFAAPSLSNRFCGDLLLTAAGNVVSAVLNVYVEEYLYGVVGFVMPPSSELEALKAQAVAARSYALNQKALESVEYDITDTADGFTFKGRCEGAEYDNVIQAVDDTRGMVLMDGDGIICGWCTESNGGQMESAANAFGMERSYTAVSDDEYDLYSSSAAKKSCKIPKNAGNLNEALSQLLVEGATRTLRQLSGDEVREVRITAIKGIRAGEAAYAAPSRVLNSLEFDVEASGWNSLGNAASADLSVTVPTFGGLEDWYDLSINDEANETVWVEELADAFEITFRRSGHGVGLSQRGAQAMASGWQACDAILARYFPGTSLVTVDLVEAETVKTDMAQVTVPAIATARLSDRVSLYTAPGKDAETAAVLAAGATLDVYAVQDDWAAVGSSGKMGYVNVSDVGGFELAGDDVTVLETAAKVAMKANRSLMQLPAGTARALASLASGENLTATAYSRQWAQVTTSAGVSGFVQLSAIELLERQDDGGAMVAVSGTRYAKLTGKADLYESTDAAKALGTLASGKRVQVLATNQLYARVKADGKTGYVSLGLLEMEAVKKAKSSKIDGGAFTKLKGKKRKVVYVKSSSLTLYKKYATNSGKVAKLKKGQKLLMTAYNSKWAYVTTGSKKGYVLRKGLTTKAPAAKKTTTKKKTTTTKKTSSSSLKKVKGKKYGTITMDLAVIYKSPSTKSEQLDWVEKGDKVRIYAYNKTWAMVTFKSTKGYLLRESMTKKSGSTTGAATSTEFEYVDDYAETLSDLKLYENADLYGAAVDTIPMGTEVHITGYQGQAAYVDINGKTGYLERGYLKSID